MFKQNLIEYIKDSGGRVIILFLLFILALYTFISAGFTNFAIICCIPLIVLITFVSFKQKYFLFWTLFVVNYCVMGAQRYGIVLPGPVSLSSELLELLIISSLIINYHKTDFSSLGNLMLFGLLLWFGLVCIEAFNDTCGLGFNFYDWFREARLSSLQLIYIFIIFSLLICNYKKIRVFIYAWAIASILAVFWAWRQKNFGFDHYENIWLMQGGMRTHFINGTIRYFSFFTDAANFGCNLACSSVLFIIIGITSRLKKEKIFFIITGCLCAYGMFMSGTRTAIFVFFFALFLYIVLSKSIRIAIPMTAFGLICLFLLAFTHIGQGNSMIRRMRTAFNSNDASKNVRDVNKESIAKYIDEAPWGIGIGMDATKIPANNKFNIVSSIPPDSTYVYTWVHYGKIGVVIYAIMNILILAGGCYIVMFKLKNPVLRGIGAAFCCGFAGINAGAYANQIMPQYPNTVLFYGSIAITYLLPKLEPAYIEFEKKDNQRLLEIKKKKEEEKNASRV